MKKLIFKDVIASAVICLVLSACDGATPTPTLTPTLTPAPGIGSTITSEEDSMTMVFVPAGEFTMGSDDGSYHDEKPVHQVYLDDFWIDQTEVTNAMYAKCVSDGACKEPSRTDSHIHLSYYGNSVFDNYPVIYVDWNMAKTYCEWRGDRLPTEAEWEKAARGTNGNIYPWGNEFDGAKVNFCDINCSETHENTSFDDGYEEAAPVGNYPSGQSVYGAYDMAGNVNEWVSSLYKPYPYNANDGREDLNSSGDRVARSSSWYFISSTARSAKRYNVAPIGIFVDLGFRCARSAK